MEPENLTEKQNPEFLKFMPNMSDWIRVTHAIRYMDGVPGNSKWIKISELQSVSVHKIDYGFVILFVSKNQDAAYSEEIFDTKEEAGIILNDFMEVVRKYYG